MGTPETINKVIKVLVGIVEVILGLTVILRLLGALPTFFFFEWIYNISEPLKSPFSGTLASYTFGDRFIIDSSAIFAMIAYLIIGFILISLVKYIFKSEKHK